MSQNFQIPPGGVEYRNLLRDSRGAVALKFGYHELVTVASDGQSTVFKESEFVTLGDNRVVSAAALASGKIDLAICDPCRYPPPRSWWREPERPSLGVMALESGDLCQGCSVFVCRKHSVVVADGSVRCLPCARNFSRRAFLRGLFYVPMDEEE